MGAPALCPGRTELRPVHADLARLRAATCARLGVHRVRLGHHLRAVAKPGGLFEDTVVTRPLARPDAARAHGGVPPRERTGTGKPPRPDTRADAGHRLRPPVRRPGERRHPGPAHGRGRRPRLAAAVVQPAPHAARAWGGGPGALYALARYPDSTEESEAGEIELASGRDFSQRLFLGSRARTWRKAWYFDGMPHRVLITDRLRMPPGTGHLTGETRKGTRSTRCSTRCPRTP